MSIVLETLIFCDGKARGFDCPSTGPYADGDARAYSSSSQREMMKKDGWKTVANFDYCPSCATHVRTRRKNG